MSLDRSPFASIADALENDWQARARSEQRLPSGDWWTVWLYLAGRGAGKTRAGAEAVREWIEGGRCGRVALIAPTQGDARDVLVEGESGLLAIAPNSNRPSYEPSKRRLTWPNGAIATMYSAEESERLRGPQHDGLWADELGAWKGAQSVWDMAMFGLRLGKRPRAIVTTTPRPIALLKALLKREGQDVVVTRGSTQDTRRTWRKRSCRRSSRVMPGRGWAGKSLTPKCSKTCRARCGAATSLREIGGRRPTSQLCGASSSPSILR